MRNICDSSGHVSSVFPATEYLTFGPWIYMVPQYKPESVLILGYAGGTTAGLIRLFYGDIPITGVDIGETENLYDVDIVKADASHYIKTCKPFDTVIVDVFDDGGLNPCDFVFTQEFVDDLKNKANYIIVHADETSDMSAYRGIKQIKVLSLNSSRFYYFMVNEIHAIPIR